MFDDLSHKLIGLAAAIAVTAFSAIFGQYAVEGFKFFIDAVRRDARILVGLIDVIQVQQYDIVPKHEVFEQLGIHSEFDVLISSSIVEIRDWELKLLMPKIKSWAEPGSLIIQIPEAYRQRIFSRIISRISVTLVNGPKEGKFMLFLVNEELSPSPAVRIIMIDLEILQNFHFSRASSRTTTVENMFSVHRLFQVRELADLILDINGNLNSENGQTVNDRVLYGWVADSNSGTRPLVGYLLPETLKNLESLYREK